ncbi:cobD [Symbiodinium sp. CCMP2592]|nr:cobD [Symbiodinium sp. CCMP2592]
MGAASLRAFLGETVATATRVSRPPFCHTSGKAAARRGFAGAETHGGDDIHKVERLVCDFSVTTNALGPVPGALDAVRRLFENGDHGSAGVWSMPFNKGDARQSGNQAGECTGISGEVSSNAAIEHYPKRADDELELLTAAFLRGDANAEVTRSQLIFGNGASELIDLLGRAAPQGKYCLNPFTEVQYREYQRACDNAGRECTKNPKDASVICLVNPNNPTGDFFERSEMEAWISEHAAPGSWVIVDESMLFWAGPDFQERGVSASFTESMVKKHINIFLVQSWTKIFSCTGLRIGTVLCPTAEKRDLLQGMQVPWSVTAFARAYLKAALKDRTYLERTWSATPAWRSHMITRLQRLHPEWKFLGKPWLSWIWIDTGSSEVAQDVYKTALKCGCPIRHAASGYDRPTVVRLAVRRPYDFSVLHQALLRRACVSESFIRATFGTSADVNPAVIEGVRLVHIDDLKPHEEVLKDRATKLQEYVRDLPVKILPAIIVDSQYDVVIDGHHRLELFKAAGMTIVPAVSVNYEHPDILVNPPGLRPDISKEQVINSAMKGHTLEPKTTQHLVRSRGGALLPIIVLAPQIAEVVHH